jgi:integrase
VYCIAKHTRIANVSLKGQRIYLGKTKNGEERSVYLPMHLIVDFANQPPRVGADPKLGGRQKEDVGVAFMERRPERRLFRFTPSGFLREMLKDTWKRAGLTFPRRQGGFHIFCHTYATWMAQYGDLDAFGLVRTGRWRDPSMAESYTHRRPNADARKADLLPTQSKKVF